MDTLTHGLLGAVIGSLRAPRSGVACDESQPAVRAGMLAGILAAELPDIDYLLPAGDAVLHALKAHRGLTHALVAVPAVALVAALLAKLVFREARLGSLYARAFIAVPLAHLLPDLWTGWGTRLLLPFSERRIALDWTMVVDPFFTLPLAVGAAWALWRRTHFRRSLWLGAAVAGTYLTGRIATSWHLTGVVREAYPAAASVHVFPLPFSALGWRYVSRFEREYAAGAVGLGSGLQEHARVSSAPTGPVPDELASVPTVHEALAWARFPVVRVTELGPAEHSIQVADLRYHLHGKPTLAFVVTIAGDAVVDARLERGGNLGELFRRWRRGE